MSVVKTANVVLNTVFNHPVIAVDTHLFRLSNRTGLAKGKTVRAVEDKLMKVVPKEFMQDASSLAYFAWTLCLYCQKAVM